MTGDQLLALRTALDLTQVELAEKLGAHGNTLARWERGEMAISEGSSRLACEIYIHQQRERARAQVIREELRGRRAGSVDRDRALRAADSAEKRAIKMLKELLGAEALDTWRGVKHKKE
jgi:transcriptional regulator with XRE-family HTH domain